MRRKRSVVAALIVFRLLYLIMPLIFALDRRGCVRARASRGAASQSRWESDMTASAPPQARRLIVVDVQYDFLPGGALAVAGRRRNPAGREPARRGLRLRSLFTQDWHPAGHASFASSHPGKQPFETDEPALRRAAAVAGPLRSGFARRGAARRPRYVDRAQHHPAQGDESGHRLLFRLRRSGRPHHHGARGVAAERAASSAYSCAGSRRISASRFLRSTRAPPASRPC